MPAVAAGAVASGAIAAATATTIAPALAFGQAFVSTLVLGGLSQLLAPKPDQPKFQDTGAGRTQSIRQPIIAHRLIYGQAKVGGALTFAHSTDDGSFNKYGYLYLCHTLAAHECESIDSVWLDDKPSTDAVYTSVARITEHLGAADQAADSDFVAELTTHWGTEYRGRGRCYLASRLHHNPTAYPGGVPNVAAIVKGFKVYDPRTGFTEWSDNPALCVAHYLTLPQASGGWGMTWDEIDISTLSAAANACEEEIDILAGGTEERYTLNGIVDTSSDPFETLETMLSAMAGMAVYTGGKWYIYAGTARTPVMHLSEDDLRGDLVVSSSRGRRDVYNSVRSTFVWPAGSWQPTDAPPWHNAAYLAEDGGVAVYRDLQLSFTVSASTAQRLMKVELERNRRETVVTFPAKLIAFGLKVGDIIQVSMARLGWVEKEFIVGEWGLAQDGGVDLKLFEHDGGIYDWDVSEEQELEIPGLVELPNNGVITSPTGLAVSIPTTTSYSSATVSWNAVQAAFLAGYDVEYRTAGATNWNGFGRVSAETVNIMVSVATDFRMRATTTGGAVSAWVQSLAPNDPSNLAAAGGAGQIGITWDGGNAHIWTSTTDNAATASLLAQNVTGHTHTGLGTSETHYYWVRCVGTDGNHSDLAGSVSATTDA